RGLAVRRLPQPPLGHGVNQLAAGERRLQLREQLGRRIEAAELGGFSSLSRRIVSRLGFFLGGLLRGGLFSCGLGGGHGRSPVGDVLLPSASATRAMGTTSERQLPGVGTKIQGILKPVFQNSSSVW